jgi:hypothetical protein
MCDGIDATEGTMVRSLVLGLVLAIGATVGQLPSSEAQTTLPQQPMPVTPAEAQTPPATASIVPPSKNDPFLKVFQTPQAPTPDPRNGTQELTAPPVENPRVICGLTMWEVDPNTDPKIRPSVSPTPGPTPNSHKKPDFKIRRIIPTLCRE